MRFSIALSTALLIISGCAEAADGERSVAPTDSSALEPRPAADVTLDFSTPESAIQSYWQLIDLERSNATANYAEQIASEDFRLVSGFHQRLRSELLPSQTMLALMDTTTFQREVTAVQREADDRAVVLTEISQAAPAAVDLATTDTSSASQRASRKVRYVLERGPTGWRAVLIDLIYE